jgi:F-type H+-transporting ATPase subunit delta
LAEWGFVVGNSVVNRYVKSLYDVAVAGKIEKDVANQIASLKEFILCFKNHKKLLKRVSLLTDEGTKFINFAKEALHLSAEVDNFLNLLLDNSRLGMILEICNAYSAFLDQVKGKKLFYLTFAKEVSDSVVDELEDNLRSVFGGEIECIVGTDSSLIEGMKLQYRSRILDYSLKSRLRRLHSAIRRENYEN